MTQVSGLDVLTGELIQLEGEVLPLEPLSFWGGVDSQTGQIIDARHKSYGICLTGKIVQMPFTKGSSSSTSVLLECMRVGTAPKAMILDRPDPIVVVAMLVGMELYGLRLPVLLANNAPK